ncbi:unnamed protein product [Soboliphyme baturini]|uniref:C3H1-type domain-containing protein n=1 Tax=Soboliphyme baturini TaxID=241478 RepID=A0A183IX27_9BILA|nr:unnamed protein product [Soboliphyme baturini]
MSTVTVSNSAEVIAVLSESDQSLLEQQKPETNAAAVYKEPDRHLPLKLKPMDEKEISRFAKDVVWEQSKAGKRIKLPFNMWKVSMQKCQVTYDDYTKLDPDRRDIVTAHWISVRNHQLTYNDPKTKYLVMNVTQHLLRGKCCGNNCRHCPFNHENVPEHLRNQKKWNGAFYEDVNNLY